MYRASNSISFARKKVRGTNIMIIVMINTMKTFMSLMLVSIRMLTQMTKVTYRASPIVHKDYVLPCSFTLSPRAWKVI